MSKGDLNSAAAELQRYAEMGGKSPLLLKRLAKLLEGQGKKKEAAAALERINYIAPAQDDELHGRLGDLYADLGNKRRAIREYRAMVASKPVDVAGAQFRLAKAYRENQQMDQAREHLLLALEEAPGFKPALQMLLELTELSDTPGNQPGARKKQ
jgi:tetratricopeptide (TPR) repeat protein